MGPRDCRRAGGGRAAAGQPLHGAHGPGPMGQWARSLGPRPLPPAYILGDIGVGIWKDIGVVIGGDIGGHWKVVRLILAYFGLFEDV